MVSPPSRPHQTPASPLPEHLPEDPSVDDFIALVKRLNNALLDVALSLSYIKGKNLHIQWGFPSWTRFVESTAQLSLSRANTIENAVHHFFEPTPNQDGIERLYSLGYFKAAILKKLLNPGNFLEWTERALFTDAQSLAHQVRETIGNHRERGDNGHRNRGEHSELFQVRLHGDQCENVHSAMEFAAEIAESDKRGHLLDLICTTFKADHVFSSSSGTKMVELYIAKIEKIMGVRLVVVDEASRKVNYGMDVIEQLADETE